MAPLKRVLVPAVLLGSAVLTSATACGGDEATEPTPRDRSGGAGGGAAGRGGIAGAPAAGSSGAVGVDASGGNAGAGGGSGSGSGGNGSDGGGAAGSGGGSAGNGGGAAGSGGAGAGGTNAGASGAGVACGNRPSPSNATRQPSMVNGPLPLTNPAYTPGQSIDTTSYPAVFGELGKKNQSAYVWIDTGRYMALALSPSTLPVGTFGSVSWEMPTTNGAPLSVMLSECPGDFASIADARCKSSGGASSIGWVVGPDGTKPASLCPLDPAKTYYLNAIFASGDDFATSTCPHDRCLWFARASKDGP